MCEIKGIAQLLKINLELGIFHCMVILTYLLVMWDQIKGYVPAANYLLMRSLVEISLASGLARASVIPKMRNSSCATTRVIVTRLTI